LIGNALAENVPRPTFHRLKGYAGGADETERLSSEPGATVESDSRNRKPKFLALAASSMVGDHAFQPQKGKADVPRLCVCAPPGVGRKSVQGAITECLRSISW
jgi:hypothetical protein